MGRLFQVIVKAQNLWLMELAEDCATLWKNSMESSVTVAEWAGAGGEREVTEESDSVGPSTSFNVNKWGV